MYTIPQLLDRKMWIPPIIIDNEKTVDFTDTVNLSIKMNDEIRRIQFDAVEITLDGTVIYQSRYVVALVSYHRKKNGIKSQVIYPVNLRIHHNPSKEYHFQRLNLIQNYKIPNRKSFAQLFGWQNEVEVTD